MQLDKVAVALRPRTAWESIDLGVVMLQRWWRSLYASFAAVYLPVAGLCLALGWAYERAWLALAVLWWLKPLFDRVALHVLSRAVFGEALGVRRTLAQASTWLATGLPGALTLGWLDLARAFHLPVAQLEGQRGRAAARRARAARCSGAARTATPCG
jgi:signal transduction histidine kinase